MATPSKTTKSERTRKSIIKAAEKIYAQSGFRAMTLRDVTSDAGVNLASVNYHFGSKSDLMREVIRRNIEPINQERLARLDALISQHRPAPVPLSGLFDALFRPLFEHAAKSRLPQLVGRILTEPADFMRSLHKEFFAELSARFLAELHRSCPRLSEEELQYRFFLSTSTMIGSVIEQVRLENISHGKLNGQNTDLLVQQLTSFVVSGFEQADPPSR